VSGKSTQSSRTPAIISPGVDIICGGALSAVVIGVFLAYAGGQTAQWTEQIDVGEIMLTNILINWPHFLASYRVLYRSRDNVKRHPWVAVVLPLLLLAVFVYGVCTADQNSPELAGLANQTMIDVLFPFAVIVLAWHYTGQSWGMTCSFAFLGGVRMDLTDRRLIRSGFRAMLVFHILWVLQGPDLLFLLDFIYPGLAAITVAIYSHWMYVFATTFLLGAMGFVRMACRSNALTAVKSAVPWMATYLWYLLIFYYPQMFFVLQIAHAFQYLIFPMRVEMNQYREKSKATGSSVLWHTFLYYGVLVFLGAIVFDGVMAISRPYDPHRQLSHLLGFAINVHHYFIDGVIWKIRNPDVRKDLFGHLDQEGRQKGDGNDGYGSKTSTTKVLSSGQFSGKSSRRRVMKLLAVVLSTTLVLAAAEVVVRLCGDVPPIQAIRLEDERSPYIRSANPVLRYELKPGYKARFNPQHGFLRTRKEDFTAPTVDAVEADAEPATVSVNSHGLRDAERPVANQAGLDRIILLGDSVVELVNYVADDQTTARQLEYQFPAGSTEVINCGVAGYCTLAEVELLRTKGLQFQPNRVVLIFVENDFWGFNLEHTLAGGIVDRPEIVESLFENSCLFRQTSIALNLFQFRDELAPAEWHGDAIGDNNVLEGFRILKLLSTEYEFKVLVAIWPSFTTEIEDRPFLPEDKDLVVEHLAWAHGLPTVRLSAYFQKDWQSRPGKPKPDWLYSNGDGMHPSTIGCQVAAVALHTILTSTEPAVAGVRLEQSTDPLAESIAQSLSLSEEVQAMEDRIGWVLRRQNRWVEAEYYAEQFNSAREEDYEEVFRNQPDLWNEYYQTGLQLLANGQLYAALDVFQRAVGVAPKNPDSRYQLGLTYLRLKQWQSAKASFEQVLVVDPTHDDAKDGRQSVMKQLKFQQ
jgi:tetratricopeptide (TPR) repeat protein